jgi:hypothetical protein
MAGAAWRTDAEPDGWLRELVDPGHLEQLFALNRRHQVGRQGAQRLSLGGSRVEFGGDPTAQGLYEYMVAPS